MAAILTILGALLLFLLQKWFYTRKWYHGLDATVSFPSMSVTEGETAVLTEEILNRKWLPLITLQVKFSISKYLKFVQTENTLLTDKNYRNDIFSIMSYEKITRKLPFVCSKRGYYIIDSLDLLSNDLFMTQKLVTVFPQNTSLYVYPKAADHELFDIPFRHLMGTVLTRRYNQEDPFEFRGIRPYEIYDSMKDINWKASARSGDLRVNQHNHTASQKVTILLNLASDSNWKYDRLFEEAIRIAVSYANACISNGIPVSLKTNGIDCISKETLFIPAGAGEGHRTAIIQGLARLDGNDDAGDFLPFLQAETKNADMDSTIYVFISRIQDQKLLDCYNQICQMSSGSQWIAPLHPDMYFREGGCPAAYSIRWEVPYVE